MATICDTKNVHCFKNLHSALIRAKKVCFVCFDALGPKSTAMVMAGWSVHLTTLFPGQA